MDYVALRKKMVEEHIIRRGITTKRLLDVLLKVERHKFVTQDLSDSAYSDFPVPIGEGQTISQPYMVALMTDLLNLKGEEKILEIGTGSGYQTAILADLGRVVYTIERMKNLGKNAFCLLDTLQYTNIKTKIGDGSLGWPEEAPFDRIIITAATARMPLPLTEQLKEGGRIIAPLGQDFSQILTLGEKTKGNIDYKQVCGCVFVPLVGKFGEKEK
ncbi:MAG: protein-L-isoaspartate(D-aspartate) O-methyltransferase [Candidatus Omnitrophota bacterium]|nr:protein-L-isoaspartate(D-aspartate) O-methyltransferase [Candidatus Omnitrophota bacterium]